MLHGTARHPVAAAAGGKNSVTAAPAPRVDSTWIEPLMVCMTRWQNISPMPLPPLPTTRDIGEVARFFATDAADATPGAALEHAHG